MDGCLQRCCINPVCYYFPFLIWIDKGHFSLLALLFWRRTLTSFSAPSSKWRMPRAHSLLQMETLLTTVMLSIRWRRFSRTWVKWELCQLEGMHTAALHLGRGKKLLVQEQHFTCLCSWRGRCLCQPNARFTFPYSQPCRNNFISTQAILWSLYMPSGCHSDLITNPGHILRALIKQFAFFPPSSLPSHWKITEFEHEVKGLCLNPESPDTAPAACHFLEWLLICQYFFPFFPSPRPTWSCLFGSAGGGITRVFPSCNILGYIMTEKSQSPGQL